MHQEYIDFLKDEVKEYDKELISMLELPSVASLRARIKKDKRDTKEMLVLYRRINWVNEAIRNVKRDIRDTQAMAKKLTGFGLLRPVRKYVKGNDPFMV